MKIVDIHEAVINEDLRRKTSELEREMVDRVASLPIPPCVPPEITNMMRHSGPMPAYCLALAMKGVLAKWN